MVILFDETPVTVTGKPDDVEHEAGMIMLAMIAKVPKPVLKRAVQMIRERLARTEPEKV